MPQPSSERRWALLRGAGFRRLLTIRLVGQFGDGLLQVGLTAFVFFSPERATTPDRIVAGFAVLLLPFSIVGPFAGVLLDRWSRQRVLLIANLVRAGALVGLAAMAAAGAENPWFYVGALVILGINRFILASLSAALPHVVPRRQLITANAVAPTAGTVATVLGATFGVVIRHLVGVSDVGTGAVLATAAGVCVLASASALLFAPDALGPVPPETVRIQHALSDVLRGLHAGLRHLSHRNQATRALLVMSGHRFLFGVATVMSILLFRNTLFPDDVEEAFAGLGLAVGAAGVGVLVGAILTPTATARWGILGWTSRALVLAAAVQLTFGLTFQAWGIVVGSVFLGAVSQSVKIGVDATLQRTVADRFRGRVFTIYDLLFNVSYVAAAALAAMILPTSGRAPWSVGAISVGYLALAAWYRRPPPRPHPRSHPVRTTRS